MFAPWSTAPFDLKGWVSSLPDYLDYMPAKDKIVSSFAYLHFGLVCFGLVWFCKVYSKPLRFVCTVCLLL